MAASAVPPGIVDPTKPAKYPVILSDELRGKSSKEIITALRFNHKPMLSSDTAPNGAKIKPSSSSNGSFDMSFTDDGGKYAYNGSRSTKENQYVLLFDPEKKVFVLHRMDSLLNMNLTRTPSINDAETLKEEYPHIGDSVKVSAGGKTKPAGPKAKDNPKSKNTSAPDGKKKESGAPPSSKSEPKPKPSQQAKEEKKKRNRSPVESEEDDDDDDGGLLVEYPDPPPNVSMSTRPQEFSPAFPTTIRRFSEFVRDRDEESDEDADAEYEDDILGEDDDVGGESGDGFKLPSPVRGANNVNGVGTANDAGEDDGFDDDLDELNAALEQELEQQASGMDIRGDSESDVSEED